MKSVFTNLWRTVVLLGCTITQLVAAILRGISLVFELIGLGFRKCSDVLMSAGARTNKVFGTAKMEEKGAA